MLRRILIRLALTLQVPPFTWIFRAYYGLAILAAVRVVRRVPGVRAIYLSGSMARSDVIYGLSDIDFKIFVDGPAATESRRLIQDRFARLRRWFPVLGPPDEKGIYPLAGFSADYRHYPLIQHLFDDRFYRHRLLWGDDLLPTLPVTPRSSMDEAATFFWALKDWTEKVTLLAGSPRISRVQMHYLFYKACCDVGLIWLCTTSPAAALGSRDAVMAQLEARLDGDDAEWVRRLARERRGRWRRFDTDPESSYRAFKHLVDRCIASLMADEPSAGSRRFDVIRPSGVPPGHGPHLDAIGVIVPEASVAVLPWSFLPRSPFDMTFEGRPVYVLSPREPLSAAEVVRLRDFYRAHMRAEAVLLVRERPGWHYSIDSVLIDHWLGAAQSDDLLGLLFGNTGGAWFSPAQAARVSGRLAAFHAQLADALRGPDLARMDGADFVRMVFAALRVAIVGREFARGRVWLEAMPDDTIGYLKAHTRLRGAFLDLLLEAYRQVSAGFPFNERLRAKGVRLLEASRAAACGDWHAFDALNAEPDECRLGVSAVIVTRNRPAQLARCLPTLGGQRRTPDELVVVDSSSDDETASLVSGWAAPFAVRLVRQPHLGVAAARNAGVRAAAHDVIAFVDDDAVLEPEWLESLEFCFLRDPGVGIAGGSVFHLECGREDAVARFMRIVQKL